MDSLSTAAHPALRVTSRYPQRRRSSPLHKGHDTQRDKQPFAVTLEARNELTVANYPQGRFSEQWEEAEDADRRVAELLLLSTDYCPRCHRTKTVCRRRKLESLERTHTNYFSKTFFFFT